MIGVGVAFCLVDGFVFVVLSCFLVITLLGASGTASLAVAVSVVSVVSVEVDIFEWVPEDSTGIRLNEKETERGTTAEEHTCAVVQHGSLTSMQQVQRSNTHGN